VSARFKLHSSALLVAMSVGIVLSGLVIGVALTTGEYFKLSGQSREGKAAYRAALSGIDDGLLRYKYASAASKTGGLFGVQDEQVDLVADYSNYKLSFEFDSLRVGNASVFKNTTDWQNRSSAALDNLISSGAKVANVDDLIDIDLSYFSRLPKESDKVKTLTIYFSYPYVENPKTGVEFLPTKYFTGLNYQLVDTTDIISKGEASQLIDEATNDSAANYSISVAKVAQCMKSTDSCHLRLKPYAVTSGYSKRLSGVSEAKYSSGKKIVYAIEARDEQNKLFSQAKYSPGTLIISSTGIAGQATRKIEAKIDLSSGKYLGLFDYGIYCGKECEGLRGVNQSE